MSDVRLPDLTVIRKYSIAVRSEFAPADEVIEALRADLDAILRATGAPRSAERATAARSESRPARTSAAARKPARKPARKTSAARKPARKATAARKPARKTSRSSRSR